MHTQNNRYELATQNLQRLKDLASEADKLLQIDQRSQVENGSKR